VRREDDTIPPSDRTRLAEVRLPNALYTLDPSGRVSLIPYPEEGVMSRVRSALSLMIALVSPFAMAILEPTTTIALMHVGERPR